MRVTGLQNPVIYSPFVFFFFDAVLRSPYAGDKRSKSSYWFTLRLLVRPRPEVTLCG